MKLIILAECISFLPCCAHISAGTCSERGRIRARESRKDTRANIGSSCSRAHAHLSSFSHSERRLKHLKSSISPPPSVSLALSLFLSCQAIMRDRNFPRARSGGNTGKYRAITIGAQKYISRGEIHGSFCRGFCNRIERSRRTNLLLSKVPDRSILRKFHTANLFFTATRNKASDRRPPRVSPCTSFS